jgi:hypothetical protein
MTNSSPKQRSHLDIEEERLDNEIKQLQQELLQLKIDKRNLEVAKIIMRERQLIDNQYSASHNPINHPA